jgi:rod shape determining protein RodA
MDWVTFSLYLSLVVVGWLMIFAVEYDGNNIQEALRSYNFGLDTTIGKQSLWIGIGLLVFFLTYVIDERFWQNFAYPVFVFSLVLLIGVLIFGQEIKGAKSWFSFGGFSFQPSEFAKFGTALALSAFLSVHNTNLSNFRSQVIAGLIFLLPVALILLQPDAGSALVFLSFLIVLFRAGMPMQYYAILLLVVTLFILGLIFDPLYVTLGFGLVVSLIMILNLRRKFYWLLMWGVLSSISVSAILFGYLIEGVVAGFLLLPVLFYVHLRQRTARLATLLTTYLLAGAGFIYSINYAFDHFLKPHQQDRLNVWLRPDLCDPQGSLYNVIQSKMAIGSGGLEGKGFLQGTLTKLNYVPEQSTDFIFCTVGEEQGFIGSVAIILLFVILLLRLVVIGERQRNDFAKYYAYGVAGIIFVHFFVNIGMTMGMLPIIGIPLPLISKGGSSLVGFTIMLAVLLKMDSNRFSG